MQLCFFRDPFHSTEVHFASFLSSEFITTLLVNPPERKLVKRISVCTLGVAWIVNERNFGQKWQCVLRLAEIGPPVARLHRYKVSRALLKGTVQNDFVTSSQCAVG
jgi:hypothetical protein